MKVNVSLDNVVGWSREKNGVVEVKGAGDVNQICKRKTSSVWIVNDLGKSGRQPVL